MANAAIRTDAVHDGASAARFDFRAQLNASAYFASPDVLKPADDNSNVIPFPAVGGATTATANPPRESETPATPPSPGIAARVAPRVTIAAGCISMMAAIGAGGRAITQTHTRWYALSERQQAEACHSHEWATRFSIMIGIYSCPDAASLETAAKESLRKGDALEALRTLDYAASLAPASPSIRLNRGKAHVALKHVAEARADLESASRLDPRAAEPLYLMGRLAYDFRPTGGDARESLDRAIAAYGEAIRRDAEYVDAYMGRAIAFEARGANGDSAKAEADWTNVARLDDRHVAARMALARRAYARSNFRQAVEMYEAVLRIEPIHRAAAAGRAQSTKMWSDQQRRSAQNAAAGSARGYFAAAPRAYMASPWPLGFFQNQFVAPADYDDDADDATPNGNANCPR